MYCFILCVVLGIEPQALGMLGRRFTTVLCPQPFMFFILGQGLTKYWPWTWNSLVPASQVTAIIGVCPYSGFVLVFVEHLHLIHLVICLNLALPFCCLLSFFFFFICCGFVSHYSVWAPVSVCTCSECHNIHV